MSVSKNQPVVRTIVPGNRTLDEIYEDEAREIVDEAIENARRRLNVYAGHDIVEDPGRLGDREEPTVDPDTGYVIPNVTWMSADNFTVAGGLEKIEEFIEVGYVVSFTPCTVL